MFVRAEVRNQPAPDSSALCSDNSLSGLPPCVRRVAYTNPVWINVEPCTNAITCATITVGDLSGTLTTNPGTGGSTGPITGTLGTIVGTVSTTLQVTPTTPAPTKGVTAATASTATLKLMTTR